MDLAALINSFATGTYAVTRRAGGSYVRGIATDGSSTSLTIRASVQPATGRDLVRLPEGRRSTETRVIYTVTQLYADGPTYQADRVTIDGSVWEVQHVETWAQPGAQGTGYRCIAQAAS